MIISSASRHDYFYDLIKYCVQIFPIWISAGINGLIDYMQYDLANKYYFVNKARISCGVAYTIYN